MFTSLYAKIGLALALILGVGIGVHLYDRHFITVGEDKCSEPKAVGDLANYKAAQAEIDRLTAVVATYEKNASVPEPVSVGLAHKLYVYAACPDRLPKAPSAAPIAASLAANASGAAEVERDTQAVFDAASADANELAAIQQAWPQ